MEDDYLSILVDGMQILGGLLEDPHSSNFEQGSKHLNNVTNNLGNLSINLDNLSDIEKFVEFSKNEQLIFAIYELQKVDETDKLYLRVAANYYLSLCYCLKLNFEQSREYLSKVENVTYSGFTRKVDTIESFRNICPEIRQTIDEHEQNTNELMLLRKVKLIEEQLPIIKEELVPSIKEELKQELLPIIRHNLEQELVPAIIEELKQKLTPITKEDVNQEPIKSQNNWKTIAIILIFSIIIIAIISIFPYLKFVL